LLRLSSFDFSERRRKTKSEPYPTTTRALSCGGFHTIKKMTMKNTLKYLFLSLLLISCSSDDSFVEQEQDRGFIELDYNGEKLSFGEKSYNGWVLNEQRDTIARFYTARIDINDIDFYDIKLYAYLDQNNQIEKLEMDFKPMLNGSGWMYHYSLEEKPMVYKNIEFDGTWLKGGFEGYLHYSTTEDETPAHLTNGKFNIPIKGLDIDWSQW